MSKRRMNFWMDEELHSKIKVYADKSGISVAGAIAVLCSYAMDTMATIRLSTELMQNQAYLDHLKETAINKDKE